ncbi:unnamed protein product [Urochloa humidicola]
MTASACCRIDELLCVVVGAPLGDYAVRDAIVMCPVPQISRGACSLPCGISCTWRAERRERPLLREGRRSRRPSTYCVILWRFGPWSCYGAASLLHQRSLVLLPDKCSQLF